MSIFAAAPGMGAVSALVALGLLLVALFWIALPFIVYSKANEILKELRALRKTQEHLEQWARRGDAQREGLLRHAEGRETEFIES